MASLPGSGQRISAQEPRAGWILYDGECGVCSRWVPAWGPTLARLGLGIAPLQTPWVRERLGLVPADLLSDIRLLGTDGRLVSRADVYRYVMRRIWWTYPIYVMSKLPGFSQVFDWAYRTFARHRMRISPGCDLPGPS